MTGHFKENGLQFCCTGPLSSLPGCVVGEGARQKRGRDFQFLSRKSRLVMLTTSVLVFRFAHSLSCLLHVHTGPRFAVLPLSEFRSRHYHHSTYAMFSFIPLLLLLEILSGTFAFPFLEARLDATAAASISAGTSASASAPSISPTWSSSHFVDVSGIHAYQDPLPGQARGPCPALNALANHGYFDRSGSVTFADCFAANVEVYNLGTDLATILCFFWPICSRWPPGFDLLDRELFSDR